MGITVMDQMKLVSISFLYSCSTDLRFDFISVAVSPQVIKVIKSKAVYCSTRIQTNLTCAKPHRGMHFDPFRFIACMWFDTHCFFSLE